MENKELIKANNQKISEQIKTLTAEEVSIIRNSVAKGCSESELAYFLNVAKSYNLNPFKKEIWAYRDGQQNLIIFAGRDGHLAAAQRDRRWSGIASSEVREGDEFEADIPNGNIKHIKKLGNKAAIIGAYAICKPHGCDIATIEIVDFSTYNKGYATWKSDPAAMIKKVAETHCLKKAYGLSGLACEYDFEVNQTTNIVHAIDHEDRPSMSHIEYVRDLILNSTYDDDQRYQFESRLDDPAITHSELNQMADNLRMNQLDPIKEKGNYSQTDIKKSERLFE
jgi:phage recombination protein Bet